MAWFRSTYVHPSIHSVKHPERRTMESLVPAIDRLRLRGLGFAAWRTASDAVESEIGFQLFLTGRLAHYRAKVTEPPGYPLPAFSISANGELVTIWPTDRRHPADIFTTTGEEPLPTGNDSLAAEMKAVLARARIRMERLRERHATVEAARARNTLRCREQEDVIAAAVEEHQQAVEREVTTCGATAEVDGLRLAVGIGWFVHTCIVLSESFFLGVPLADKYGVDTSSLGAALASPLLPLIGITSLVLTHGAIELLADSMARLSAYRGARTFEERRLSRLLRPSIFLLLVLGALNWINDIRAAYAASVQEGGSGSGGFLAVAALLLIVAAVSRLRLREFAKKRRTLVRQRQAVRAVTLLAAHVVQDARADDARLRNEAARIEADIDAIRNELEAFVQGLRQRAHREIAHNERVVRVLEDLMFRDLILFARTARRFGSPQLVPERPGPRKILVTKEIGR
jgi:CHASE3 domain sensor protein